MFQGFAKVFGSLFGKKNSPVIETAESISPPASVGANHPELDGLAIEEYARRQNISTEDVWNRLRRGQLVGRTSRGKVLVYESISAAAIAAPAPALRQGVEGDLPPLEFGASIEPGATRQDPLTGAMVALESAGLPQSTELALLLDHLSLAKEENREILRLTQDTLTKLSSMTDAVIQMKDEVIKTKDTQLAALRDALDEKERAISRVLQEKEDLEILNRTLGAALGNAAGPGGE